jgi:hypothetical protein
LIMLPLLPFIAGLVTGAVTAKLWRNGKTSQTLANAKAKTSETLESARTEHSRGNRQRPLPPGSLERGDAREVDGRRSRARRRDTGRSARASTRDEKGYPPAQGGHCAPRGAGRKLPQNPSPEKRNESPTSAGDAVPTRWPGMAKWALTSSAASSRPAF